MDGPEGVDLDRVRDFLVEHVPGASAGAPLRAELIAGGKSNLTYEISDGARSWVLRRPPLGHVLPTAHDMSREFRVQRALRGTGVPVPEVYAYCDDADLIGATFYVMEKVDGVVMRDPAATATLSAEQAEACSRELIEVLARIHAVDYEAVGLDDFGRPVGFVERQVRRWGEQWDRSKTRQLPAIDEVARRLHAAVPPSGAPSIVHGDYRLDNTMLAPDDPARIVAVLDWEMATIGDPLTDLGLFLVYWGGDGAARALTPGLAAGSAAGPTGGFLDRDAVVEHYARVSGRDVAHLDFYEVLATYKLAVIVEGINARFRMGKTVGDGFSGMDVLVEALAERALTVADGSAVAALRG